MIARPEESNDAGTMREIPEEITGLPLMSSLQMSDAMPNDVVTGHRRVWLGRKQVGWRAGILTRGPRCLW